MPNYQAADLLQFAAERNKRPRDQGQTDTSNFTLTRPDGTRVWGFTWAQEVDSNGRGYNGTIEGSTERRLMLANDSLADRHLAQMKILSNDAVRQAIIEAKTHKNVTNPDGTFKENKSGIKKLETDHIKPEIDRCFDVGNHFLSDGEWNYRELKKAAVDWSRIVDASQGNDPDFSSDAFASVLKRQEETIMFLISNACTKLDSKAMMEFVSSNTRRADAHDAEMQQVWNVLDQHGEYIDELRLTVADHEARLRRLESGQGPNANQDPVLPADLQEFLGFPLENPQMRLFTVAFQAEDERILANGMVKGKDFRTLQAQAWLNEVIINACMKRMCASASFGFGRAHAFSSFFFPKLLNEHAEEEEDRDIFDFEQVRSWSNKIHGSIFQKLDMLVIPINKGNVHWALLVVDFVNLRVKAYDSLGWTNRKYLKHFMEYLRIEHQQREGCELPEGLHGWQWSDTMIDQTVPRQDNGWDCGVFVCLYAHCVLMGKPFDFDQEMIDEKDVRVRIGLTLLTHG